MVSDCILGGKDNKVIYCEDWSGSYNMNKKLGKNYCMYMFV